MTGPCFFDTGDRAQGIARSLSAGLEARVFVGGDNVMVSVVRVAPGASGDVHAHPEEQWGYLVEGSGVRTQDGVGYQVSTGHLWFTPGNVPHGFTAGPGGAVILDIFSPPRDDYRKPGSGFGS